jgi:hypothetical protein
VNNIFVLDKNFNKIGTLSNQGANPPAPYFNDLYIQELDTGADTFQFSTISNKYTQDLLEVGNHIMFAYKNRHELFTITSLEYSHSEGYMTIGVYAEGLGFELLDIYMEKPKKTESGGGNDSDGDGDDNTDDEYADPDDVYIDEDGNIIYDKDGSGPPSADDVTIDGDGNIIYQPGKNKNKNNDHLEFKNISYPTFLNIMLKNTGWNYICQPGLKSNKQDMRVSYDKNIYAILQDSMQTYKGVELEFVYEYNNGSIIKTVKAYNDGGRGSFVGKRFKYGQNVRGITKTQEVCTEKEDAIIFVDDVGVEIYYDIDFALKSAEVPEIEIGDTHYVIDSDFCPPMQIKARIGKIEISFSDLTRNKIYLANNKKIRGSEDDDFDEDDIKDIIDDYEPEIDDIGEHYHYELINITGSNTGTGKERGAVGYYGRGFSPSSHCSSPPSLGSGSSPWGFCYLNHITAKSIRITESLATAGEGDGEAPIVALIEASITRLKTFEEVILPNGDVITPSSPSIFSGGSNSGPDTNCVSVAYLDNRLLDYATKDYVDSKLGGSGSGSNPDTGSYPNIFDPDAPREDIYVGHVEAMGFNAVEGHIGSLSTTQIYGWNNSTSDTIEIYGDVEVIGNITAKNISGGSASGNTFDTITVRNIRGPQTSSGPDDLDNRVDFANAIALSYIVSNNASGTINFQDKLVLHNGFSMYGDLEVSDNIEALGTVTAKEYKTWSDKSLKENIRYIGTPITYNDEDLLEKADLYDFIMNQVNICEYNYIGDTANKIGIIANDYEGTKVGDKIVSRDKDDILSYDTNNLLFATIGALQEEVRIKDEQIATLEARLAKIEALLGIDN